MDSFDQKFIKTQGVMHPFKKHVKIVQVSVIHHDTILETLVQTELNNLCNDLGSVGIDVIDVRVNRDENGRYWSVVLYK